MVEDVVQCLLLLVVSMFTLHCREMAMLMSIMQTAPHLAASLEKGFRQVLIEVERAEKLSRLEVLCEAAI